MKLTQFQNPLTGREQNLSLATIWQMVLGGMVIVATLGFSQKLLNAVHNKVPAVPNQLDKFTRAPVVVQVSNKRVI